MKMSRTDRKDEREGERKACRTEEEGRERKVEKGNKEEEETEEGEEEAKNAGWGMGHKIQGYPPFASFHFPEKAPLRD